MTDNMMNMRNQKCDDNNTKHSFFRRRRNNQEGEYCKNNCQKNTKKNGVVFCGGGVVVFAPLFVVLQLLHTLLTTKIPSIECFILDNRLNIRNTKYYYPQHPKSIALFGPRTTLAKSTTGTTTCTTGLTWTIQPTLPSTSRSSSSSILYSIVPRDKLFSSEVYETILNGRIAVVPEFLSSYEVTTLRNDAQNLYDNGFFTSDALASYGTSRDNKFDPSRDRTVLKLNQWQDPTLGNYQLRTQKFASQIGQIRTDLSYQLNRPQLVTGAAVNRYGKGSTEISYTRFGPGAYLKKHVDEHHEELKGKVGWYQPTRRSISWLIYLNDRTTWNVDQDGGCLRCYERQQQQQASISSSPSSQLLLYPVGARSNGDLQIGWVRPDYVTDPIDRPVFLDARYSNNNNNNNNNDKKNYCAMYIDGNQNILYNGSIKNEFEKIYITNGFHPNPSLFVAGSELLMQQLFITRKDLAKRFQFIEPPKSRLQDLLNQYQLASTSSSTSGSDTSSELPIIQDIPPLGGTLVLFDSVTLPHEVLPTLRKERWATSGWFHEDQQQPSPPPHS